MLAAAGELLLAEWWPSRGAQARGRGQRPDVDGEVVVDQLLHGIGR